MLNEKIFFLMFFLLLLLLISIRLAYSSHLQLLDYKDHPCIRKCDATTKRMKCEYNWTIEWYSVLSKACLDCPFNTTNCHRLNCVSGDGVFRPIMTVNRMIPGPAIDVCQNDTIHVNLYNLLHLSEGTSIHWHGIRQIGTPFMDGVSMITQCPIIAHTFFQHNFIALDYGTHLWHAHSGLQRADGVFGPLIIRQFDDDNVHLNKYDYDLPEHIITVNDWIHETSIAKFSGHHHNNGDTNPHSLLINGKGVLHKFGKNGSWYETPRAVFSVKQGHKYRFRLINAGFLYCPIEFFIDNHNMTVIASDGKSTEPNEVVSIIIYAGERYDFILNANQPVKNYWIKAKGYAGCAVLKVFQTAILNYFEVNVTKSNELPGKPSQLNYDTMSKTGIQLNPWNKFINNQTRSKFIQVDEMRSVLDKEATAFLSRVLNATQVKKFYLAMNFNKINNPEFFHEHLYSLSTIISFKRQPFYTPQINNISMMMPSTPVLYQWNKFNKNLICNETNKNHVCPENTEYCACIYLLEFNMGDVVEFVIIDEGLTFQPNHPMHLHGSSFAVLGIEKLNKSIHGDYVKKLDDEGKLKRNFDRPPIKDTVTVPVGGYTIIRFVADNPGTWMFHCHLDFHSEVGMGLLIRIGQDTDLPSPPPNWPQCGNFYFQDKTKNSNSAKATLFNSLLLLQPLLLAYFILSIGDLKLF